MKTKVERMVISDILSGLGLQLLSKHMPKHLSKQIKDAISMSRSEIAKEVDEETFKVIMDSSRVIEQLGYKLINCQNVSMLAHALMLVESMNTARVLIVEDEDMPQEV